MAEVVYTSINTTDSNIVTSIGNTSGGGYATGGTVITTGGSSGAYWGYPSGVGTTSSTITIPIPALKSDLDDIKKTMLLLSKAIDDLNARVNFLMDVLASAEEWEDINSETEEES